MKKNILIPLIIIGVIVLVAGAGVGGFFGGKAYEKNNANKIRNDFMQARGIRDTGQNGVPGMGMNPGQNANGSGATSTGNFPGGGMGNMGTTGEVKSIDGNTLTLTSGGTETVITLSDTTTIIKYTTGSTADLSAGQQVMVSGERDSNGNITTATGVTILETGANQAPAGTTP